MFGLNMSKKSARIAQLIENCRGQRLPSYYLAYFECFNRELFFESHDVLEELWLLDRTSPNHSFYKALIQLAGAFVHLQKDRLRPSAALFKLAHANLRKYPSVHEYLDVGCVLVLVEAWLNRLEASEFRINPLRQYPAPKLTLLDLAPAPASAPNS